MAISAISSTSRMGPVPNLNRLTLDKLGTSLRFFSKQVSKFRNSYQWELKLIRRWAKLFADHCEKFFSEPRNSYFSEDFNIIIHMFDV